MLKQLIEFFVETILINLKKNLYKVNCDYSGHHLIWDK